MNTGRYARSNIGIGGTQRAVPLTLNPSEATTYNLESSIYKGLYTNKIVVNGTTAKATILLPKVAANKNCVLEVSQTAGTNYAEFKYQTAEQSGASVLQLSAAQLNGVLYCDGGTWTVIEKSATNVNA